MKEKIELICWLVFICSPDGTRSCPSEEVCHRRPFHKVDGFSLDGMLVVRKGPWPWRMCRRLCRQYFECTWFSVEWQSEKGGMCSIYNGWMNLSNLTPVTGVTLFARCPLDFSWDSLAKTCYTTTLYGPAIWSEAVAACRDLYPGAKLAEPRNKIQNDWLEAFIGGQLFIWLGMYRPLTSSDVYEIRYSSDDSLLSYSKWDNRQPNDAKGVEDCVVGSDLEGMPWYDRKCGDKYKFVCQF